MKMSKNSSSSGGIGFLGLLQLALIVLKFCKVITWSWWLVLVPLWFVIAFWIGIIIFICWLNK